MIIAVKEDRTQEETVRDSFWRRLADFKLLLPLHLAIIASSPIPLYIFINVCVWLQVIYP